MNNSVDVKVPRRVRNVPANFKSHAGLSSNVSLQVDFLDRTLEPEPDTAGAKPSYNNTMMFDVDSQHDLRLAPQNSAVTTSSKPVSTAAECGIPNRPIQHTRSMSRRNQQ